MLMEMEKNSSRKCSAYRKNRRGFHFFFFLISFFHNYPLICSNVVTALGGLQASVPQATISKGSISSLRISLLKGTTNMSLFIDWGDKFAVSYLLNDTTDLQPQYNHTYDDAGDYEIFVWVSNQHDKVNYTLQTTVFEDISGICYTVSEGSSCAPATFNVSIENGTHLSLFWRFGDGTNETWSYDNYTVTNETFETNITHQYAGIGAYNWSVIITNPGAKYLIQSEVIVVDNPTFNVLKSWDGSILNPEVTFNHTFTNTCRGQTCSRFYGNDDLLDIIFDVEEFNESFSYTYPSTYGMYDFEMRCYTAGRYMAYLMEPVYVVYEIADPLIHLEDVYWVNLGYEKNLIVPFSFNNGTNITCNVKFDEGYDNGNMSYETTIYGESSGVYNKSDIDLGSHSVDISCSNRANDHVFPTITIMIQLGIENLTLISQPYVEPNDTVWFYANTSLGSPIEYEFDYGDVSPNDTALVEKIYGSNEQLSKHRYVSPGYYTATVYTANNMSNAIAYMEVGVEYPVPENIVLTVKNVTRPAEKVQLNITHPGVGIFDPNSTRAAWDMFSKGNIDSEEDMELGDGNPYIYEHQFAVYGDFITTVSIYNNVSRVNKSIAVRIGIEIENFYCCDENPYIHAVGVEMKFNCHVDKGSYLKYGGHFGDGANISVPYDRNNTEDWTVADDKLIGHSYGRPGYFMAELSARNVFNFAVIEVPVFVFKQVTGLTLVPVIQHLMPLEVFTFFANITDGTNIKFDFNFGDNSTNETMLVNQINGSYEQSVTHTYTKSGRYRVTVICSNNVSSETAVTDVYVENPVDEDIVLSVVNVSRPTEKVKFTVTKEQNSTADPDSTAATWDYFAKDTADKNESMILKYGTPYVHEHTYPDYGNFTAKVTIYNNISSVTKEIPFKIGIDIENFYCDNIDPFTNAVGAEIKFNCHVDQGSDLKYSGSFGDGQSISVPSDRTQTNDWRNADDTVIKHKYDTAGYFTVTLNAANIFGSATISFMIFVHEAVAGLTLMTAVTHLQPLQDFTFYANITNGSKVNFEFDLKDASPNQIREMDQITGVFKQDITHQYTVPGYYGVCVTAHNNISSASACFDIGVEYPVPISITFAVVNVTRPEKLVVFTLTHPDENIPYANSTIAVWDYLNTGNTSYTEEISIYSGNPYTHTHNYTDIYGDFEAQVTVYNNVSSLSKIIPLRIGVPTFNFDCSTLNSPFEGLVEMKIKCHVDQGSTVHYQIDFGDQTPLVTVERQQQSDWTASDDREIAHTYGNAGQYTLKYKAINNPFVAVLTDTEDIIVYQKVVGVKVNSSHLFAKVDEEVTMTVSVSGGSFVYSALDYGDNSQPGPRTSHKLLKSSDRNILFRHKYTKEGNYTPIAKSDNTLSQGTLDSVGIYLSDNGFVNEIVIQQELTTIKLTAVQTIIKVPSGLASFEVENTGSVQPTDVFCVWTFPDDTTEWTYAPELMATAPTTHKHSHSFPSDFVGSYNITVNCSNQVSNASAEVEVIFQQVISNPYTISRKDIVAVSTESIFAVAAKSGSHLQYDIAFQDGLTATLAAADSNKLNISAQFEVKHTYLYGGNYTVIVRLYNDVSEAKVTHLITVQQPITESGLDISFNSPVMYPPGIVNFNVKSKAAPHPDNVFLTWDFGNGVSVGPEFAQTITFGKTLVKTYTYKNPTVYNLNMVVNASNLISSIQMTINLTIVRAIEGFSLKISDGKIARSITETVYINATADGSDVLYAVNMGDNSPLLQQQMKTDNQHSFSHKYSKPGNYTVSATATNAVSSMSYNLRTLVIQNGINPDKMTITCSQYVLMDRQENAGAFNVEINVQDTEPTTVHFLLDTEDGKVSHQVINSWPFKYVYNYTYQENMELEPTVGLKLENMISNSSKTCVTQIQEKLTNLSLKVPSSTLTGEVTPLEINLLYGSFFTVEVNYGDGQSKSSIKFNNATRQITLNHVYNAQNTYKVTVVCKNDVTDQPLTVSTNVNVFNPVPDIVLKSGSSTPVTSTSMYELLIEKLDKLAPNAENTSIHIDFGDGVSLTEEISLNTRYSKFHKYAKSGDFLLKINVSNEVSWKSISQVVFAEEPIKGFKVYVKEAATGRVFNDGENVPVGQEIVFNVIIAEGTNVFYKWLLDDVKYTGSTFKHVFKIPSNVKLLANVSNHVSMIVGTRNLKIFSNSEIDSFTYNTSVIVQHPVIFKLVLKKEVLSDVCFQMELKSSSLQNVMLWTGTSESLCKARVSDFDVKRFNLVKSGIIFTQSFIAFSVGFYEVLLKVMSEEPKNDVLLSDKGKQIEVQGKPCDSPVLKLIGSAGTIDNPIQFKKNSEINAPSDGYSAVINCEATPFTHVIWQMFVVENGKEVKVNYTDYSGVMLRDRLQFPATMLPYGLYHFIIIITMHGLPHKSDSAEFYVEIISSKLVAFLPTSLRMGNSHTFTHNAEDGAGDPDKKPGSNNKEGIVYEWFCGMMDPNDGEFQCPSGVKCEEGLTVGILKGSEISKLDVIAIPNKGDKKVSDWKSGCFGTGTGKLDTTSGTLTFETSTMEPGRWYRILLRVSKGDRSTIVAMNLEVILGDPPILKAECYDSNMLMEVCGRSFMGSTEQYQILVNCESCSEEQNTNAILQYDVVETIAGNRRKRDAQDIKKAISIYDNNGGKLFKIPKNTLLPGSVADFDFTLNIPGLQKGKLAYRVAVNGRPSKGSFDVEPKEGKAIETELNMAYKGWRVFDPDSFLSYQFESCKEFSNPAAPQDCATKYLPRTKLDQGLETNDFMIGLRMVVCDDYFTCTKTDFIPVKIIEAAEGAADNAIKSALMESNPTAVFDLLVTVSEEVPYSEDTSLSIVSDTAAGSSSGSSSGSGGSSSSGSGSASGAVIISGSTNYNQLSAQQKAVVDAQIKVEEEKKKKEQARMASVISAMVAMTVQPSGTPKTMSVNQMLQAMEVMAKFTKKTTRDISVDAKLGSQQFLTAMASNLDALDPNQRARAINNLLNVAGNLGKITITDVVIVKPQPVNWNGVVDEAEEERLKQLRLEQALLEKKNALQTMQVLDDTASQISTMAKKTMIVDGDVMTFGTENMQITAHLASPYTLSNATYQNPEFNTTIPVLPNLQEAVFLQMVYMPNFLTFDESAKAVSTGLTKLSITNDRNERVSVQLGKSNPVRLTHNVPGDDNWADTSNLTVDSVSNLAYYHVGVDINETGYMSCLHPKSDSVSYGVYISLNVSASSTRKPNKTEGEHDYKAIPEKIGKNFCFKVPQNEIYEPGFFVGIEIINTPSSSGTKRKRSVATQPQVNDSSSIDFSMNSILTRCRSWDESRQKWTTDKCSVGKRSTLATTECECTELSNNVNAFAGGVSLPQVNTINFANVFANFSALLAANPTVFATIVSILGLYALIGIWSRHMDRKDIEKWGVTPLVDNKSTSTYCYKISIFTGMRRGAGTRSKVCFILSGDKGDTGVRVADDGNGKYYTRGSVRHFIMTTEYDIGAPTFLRVWHDNSGKDAKASWFLDKVAIADLKNKTRYFFFCSRWLAAEEDDGQVDRILPVAGNEELEDFNNLFFTKTRKKLTDDHLWFSIASRPTRSTFSRFQRLTCCVALLFTTMIVNAMFFRSEPEVAADAQQPDTKIMLGPIILSVNSILVSVFGALIVIPINMIIVQIFRKSKPKNWKEVNEAEIEEIKKQTRKYLKDEDDNNQGDDEEQGPQKKKKKAWKKKYPLPYQCHYVGWTLAILSILVSAFFIILYSLDWGETKSLEWLSSFVFSVCQSIAIIQPVKIVFIAAIMSIIFKTFDEVDEDEHTDKITNTKPDPDEEFLDVIKLERAPLAYIPKPPGKRKLEEARRNRIFERKMWDSIKEVIYYVMFMILIGIIAWGPKLNVYHVNDHVKMAINDLVSGDSVHADEVLSGHDFWTWLQDTAIPSIFYHTKYNGDPTTMRERSFMSDMLTYRVGPIRLRQARIIPGSCTILSGVKGIVSECNQPYSIAIEESRNFSVGWQRISTGQNGSVIKDEDLTPLQKSFLHYSMFDLKNLPYWGLMGTYGGGGFVADLGSSKYQANKLMTQLKENDWIDFYTRAVFLEFTVYNPNTNLFSYVNYLMEFPATGAVLASERITSFQVYSTVSGIGGLVIAAQLVYCVAIIYFIVSEIIKMKNQKKEYWRIPWNYLEVGNIISSITAIAMFVLREKFGRIVQNQLKADKGGYTNYMALAVYSENIEYFVALIVFFANLKLLRLLRFNKHVAEFSKTLCHAATELSYFGFTFFLMFMGFGMWGYFVFGRNLHTFSTFIRTLETLFSMLLGKFDMYEIEAELDSYMGKFFILTFTYLCFFILVTMFLAILNAAYDEVRCMPKDPFADYKVVNFVVRKIQKLLHLRYEVTSDSGTGDAYVDLTDIVDMRLTALDQHINHMYKEILQASKAQKTNSDVVQPQEKVKKQSFFQRLTRKKEIEPKKRTEGNFFKDLLYLQ